MAELGQIASLKVVRERKFGLVRDSEGPLGEVLLPRAEMPATWEMGERVRVFLSTDSDDRPVATTRLPKAVPGTFAALQVLAVTGVGAFLDWGLAKDLLLPFGEQKTSPRVGQVIVVRVAVDEESGRIIASQRLGRYFSKERLAAIAGDEVDLLVYARTELGWKVVVNGTHNGLIYGNEVFRHLRPGERTKGWIKEMRPDGKIDVSLYPPRKQRNGDIGEIILAGLRERGGEWDLHDNSDAKRIHRELGISKKAFKQAIGTLFRERKILIGEEGIRLIPAGDWSPGDEG
jgi:predicted RNA-binding protein (virulence factor B family)